MNDDYSKILFIIAFFIGLGILGWIVETISNSIKYKKLKPQFNELENSIKKHEANVRLWNEEVQRDKEAIQKITNQKSMGFPWLADAYADYFSLKDLKKEEYLKNKRPPAYKAAETVKEIRNEKKY
jgi:hypothetical protein